MKLLLIGNNGQLGWELMRTLSPLGEVVARDFPEIDLADEMNTRKLVRDVSPDVIINAAAYTAVDRAESEPSVAMAVNGTAPGVLADEAKSINACLVHFSTDYVFDGEKGEPYVEADTPNPLNVYGMSKLAGEQTVLQSDGAYLVFRTSWVYSLRVGGFVNKVLRWAREQDTLRIVDDQIGSPTWARMLAEVTAQILAMGQEHLFDWVEERKGLYHLGGSGAVSRFDFAGKVLALDPKQQEQIVRHIEPASTSDFELFAVCPNLWHSFA